MPHTLRRTVTTRWDADSVFAYLLDFEHAEEWDSGTVSCERLTGDGGIGTRYRNVSKFLGRETTLDYEVEKIVPGRNFVITGENKTVISKDTVIVTPSAGSTSSSGSSGSPPPATPARTSGPPPRTPSTRWPPRRPPSRPCSRCSAA